MPRRFWTRAVPMLAAGSFAAGLLTAGLFHFPNYSQAQRPVPTQAQAASALTAGPGAQALANLSDAFSAIADRVRPSVVYIESSQRRDVAERSVIPP